MNWRGLRMKWGCLEWSLAVVGFVIIAATVRVTEDSKQGENIVHVWRRELEVTEASNSTLLVNLTLVEAAASKGAFCLDGTLPGYHLHRGFGSGSNSWLIHLEGGGWCNNLTSCFTRKNSSLGSSAKMEKQIEFTGILSNKPSENPDFYNWNRVKVRYCDGASYSGDVEDEIQEYKLFFRGQRIWKAVMEDLLAKGLGKAAQGLLSGCSAGGLATFLHCDNFRELLPQSPQVKCFGDAGFFLDTKDISGVNSIKKFYNEVITLQGVDKHLPKSCASQKDPTKCFFPQYLLQYIHTPFFILNSAYDAWQIQNILAPDVADPEGHWQTCKLNIKNCTQPQLEILQDFRIELLRALKVLEGSKIPDFRIELLHALKVLEGSKIPDFRIELLHALKVLEGSKIPGMFINSCFIHCQSENQRIWFSQNSTRLNNKTIAEAVGDWYFDRMPTQYIDCPYPCDSTCYEP